MSNGKCQQCDGDLERRSAVVTEVGPYKVVDASALPLQCAACGHADMSLADARAYELRAARTVLMDLPEIPGGVMKYARKAMGLRQEDLAELLGLDRATVSRLETGTMGITRQTQLALLGLLEVAKEGPAALTELKNQPPIELGAELRMRRTGS